MKIVIETAVFADPANTMALNSMGYWALKGRHRIVVQDDDAPLFLTWLEGLNKTQRAEWSAIMEDGYLREAFEPARRSIYVTPEQHSEWDRAPPRLSVRDLVQFISLPFRILLEDNVSDRGFLLKMATSDQRNFFVSRETDGHIVFEHGGGITSMARRVATIRERDDHQSRLSVWAMFDSDALQPMQPSSQSESLKDKCVQAQIPHHRLERRSIENYLPMNAISSWAYARRTEREARFLALLELNDVQRNHYNFKHGFLGDAGRPAPGSGELYNGLSGKTIAALQRGLGAGIANLFEEETVTERDLRRDSGWSEVNPIVTELIAMLR